jgi:hypothetical protein
MAAKKKAQKTGAGVWAAGKAARNNPYVERLIDDEDLRDNLRTAFEASRRAYERIADGRGAGAIVDDKKTQKQLKEAASSLREAAETLRGAKRGRRRKRRGGLLLMLLVGGGAAVALNEGLRKKVLDLIFGAEEEFEYSSVTAAQSPPPPGPGAGGGAGATSSPAGSTESAGSPGSAGSAAAVGGPPAGSPPEGPVGTS